MKRTRYTREAALAHAGDGPGLRVARWVFSCVRDVRILEITETERGTVEVMTPTVTRWDDVVHAIEALDQRGVAFRRGWRGWGE